ncbi:MAG: VCBS repeat-containing protein, partial [Leptospiraceae bacterium]|nr:VCBS repeat-containing protein [Leptospiraceae bacterium]
MSTADIDGDGAKELWIAEDNGKTLKIVKPSNYVFNQVSDTGLVIDNIGYDPNNMKLTSNNFAIDVDADGRTDFVMVYDSPNENKTRFKIYLSNGTGFSSNPIQIETGYADSENSLRFLSDIDSDRKPEWITINKNSLDKMVVHRIDIRTATSSSSEYDFAFGGSTNYKNVSFADVNGDGKIDLLAVLENGDVSVCLFTGDGFTGANISNSLNPKPQFLKPNDTNGNNPNTFAEEQNTKVFADINGDRKADLITFNGSAIYVSYSNGNGYPQYDMSKEAKGLFQLADINADGKVDIVALGLKEVVKKTPFLFTLDGFFVESMDINEYEPVASLEILFSDKETEDLVERVSTNDGKETKINYEFNRDVVGAVKPETGSYPNLPNLSGDYLVTTVETNPGDGLPITKETYQYSDSKVRIGNNDETGLLGFKSTTKETSVITPEGEKKVSTQITEYNQTDPIELGKPSKVKTYNADGNLQDEVSIRYEKATTPNGTLTHRIKSQNDTIYENGNYFSQNTISYQYDTNGNVTKETTNIEGNITEVEKSYSPLNQLSTYTKKSNGVVIDNRVYTYTGVNLSSSSVEIQPGKWATTGFEHDDKGNITSIINPIGQATTITYNSNSQATEATNHLGHTISYKYDSKTGQITKKTDINGGVSEIEFDDYGKITLVKNPGESNWSKKFIYSNSPNNTYVEERERIVDASEGVSIFPLPLIGSSETYTWTRNYFDNEGKIRKKETSGKDGKVYTEDFVYDYLGRLIGQTDPYVSGVETPKYTTLEYDDTEGRLTKVVKPDGNEVTYSYNRFTVTKTSTDKPTEVATSNALGQVLSQTIGDLTTSYTYNESGRVSEITEPSGNKVSLDYDRAGNILTKMDSNSGKITYTYNLIGNLTSTKDARGVTIKYTYYQDGRMHKYSANGEEVEYFYDENQVNAKGKVTKIKDSTGEVKLEYDKRGNVVKRTHLIEDYEIKFEYAHDSMNRVRQIIYPDGTIVSYIYNDKELETIKMLPNDGRSKELKMLGFQFDET